MDCWCGPEGSSSNSCNDISIINGPSAKGRHFPVNCSTTACAPTFLPARGSAQCAHVKELSLCVSVPATSWGSATSVLHVGFASLHPAGCATKPGRRSTPRSDFRNWKHRCIWLDSRRGIHLHHPSPERWPGEGRTNRQQSGDP